MLYRTMPKNGDKLSILGFGLMRLPTSKDGSIDEERAISQVRDAVDRGVNYLDTAWPYHSGQSERFLNRVLQDGYRDKIKVATKLPSWLIESRADMDKYLNAQLDKIDVAQIDYYLLHALNGEVWDKLVALDVFDFLDKALADGRMKYAGFSFHGLLKDFKRIVDGYPWTFCQIQYNYLDQQNQAGTEGLEYAAARDLGVIIMEPLRGGNLAMPEPPPAIDEIWNRAATRRAPVDWALRWIWNRPEVTVVLSGMNDEDQVAQNLAIAGDAYPGSLSEDECSLVDEAAQKYQELMKVGCTGCGYCLPCPEGVHIPGAFEVYNKMHLFGNEAEGKLSYAIRLSGGLTGSEPGWASQCVECGECIEKCPQGLEIPTYLADVAEEMEDDQLEERLTYIRKMFEVKEP